jgi:hypothetical protein
MREITKIKEYSFVRIVKLLNDPNDPRYFDTGSFKRIPQIGDVGFCIDIFRKKGVPDGYFVDFSLDIDHICYGVYFEEELEAVDD